jgi:hypothetical protein
MYLNTPHFDSSFLPCISFVCDNLRLRVSRPWTLQSVPCIIVLMPPADPNDPNSQYDFILNGDKQATPHEQAQTTTEAPKFFLPKKALIGFFGGVFILIIGIVVISSLSKNTGPSDQVIAIIGTGQEIVRVNDLVAQQTKDPGTLSIAATSSAAINSELAQFNGYIANNGAKYNPKLLAKMLATYTNSKTDADLANAEQNNALDATYYTYLKEGLTKYQSKLQAVANNSSPTLKPIVKESLTSTQNLLTAPQLTQTTSL